MCPTCVLFFSDSLIRSFIISISYLHGIGATQLSDAMQLGCVVLSLAEVIRPRLLNLNGGAGNTLMVKPDLTCQYFPNLSFSYTHDSW
jgi:hypothetical protein